MFYGLHCGRHTYWLLIFFSSLPLACLCFLQCLFLQEILVVVARPDSFLLALLEGGSWGGILKGFVVRPAGELIFVHEELAHFPALTLTYLLQLSDLAI
jgi:hypothetical protein